MSKYIGTPVVSLSTDTVDVTGDITTTDATPEVIIVNDTHEDTDGGREGKVTFKGQASGGEETTLAQIQASHDGTSDDEKGDLIFKTNDGSDGASPTEAMRIDSAQNVGIGTTAPNSYTGYTALTLNNATNGGLIDLEHNGTLVGELFLTDVNTVTLSAVGAKNVSFNTNSAERMRITNGGSLGIGTTAPLRQLSIANSGAAEMSFISGTSSNASILFGDGLTGTDVYRGYIQYEHANDAMAFAAGVVECMRIDSSGNLLVGSSATFDSTDAGNGSENRFGFIGGTLNIDRNSSVAAAFKRTSSNGTLISLNRGGSGTVGSISVTTGAAAFNTSSDYRLKENVTDVTDGITRIKQLAPKRFNFIVDADKTVDGFLAHEAATVVPEAVTGTKDAMMDEEYEVKAAKGDVYTPATDDADEVVHSSNVEQPDTLEDGQQWRETAEAVMGTRSVPDMQGIDQAKLVPLLTAALQEAIAKIETLETKVAALEGE